MSSFTVDLTDQTALVTGAGAGIGRAIALSLAGSGASVALSDLNIERAESVAAEIHERGGACIALHADISNRFQTANMIERARDAYGKIHILVNAAGIFKAEPMLKIDEWDWRRQIEVNTTGAFFCLQLVGRVMADEGGGRIINLVSTVGYNHSIPAGIPYAASKGSIIAMTRQAAASSRRMASALMPLPPATSTKTICRRSRRKMSCWSESVGPMISPMSRFSSARQPPTSSPVK